MQTWDFGNAIAALVAVGGYMAEHLFSRKQVSADAHICCDIVASCNNPFAKCIRANETFPSTQSIN